MSIYAEVLALAILYFSLVFILAVKLKNNSVAESFLGLGFIVVALFCLWRIEPQTSLSCQASTTTRYPIYTEQLVCPGNLSPLSERVYANPPAMIILACVMFWGLRLSLHVIIRNYKKGENWRYAAWRKKWGSSVAFRSYIQIFLVRALVLWVVSLPIQYVFAHPNPYISTPDYELLALYAVPVGILVWLIGFYFEFMSDWQLRRFKNDPKNKGKILLNGLWRYSRHPNYFGEATLWWGIFIMSLGVSPPGWWTIVSPLTVTLLLRFVSGVPLMEQKLRTNPKYVEYARRTNAMFPGPSHPRRAK
jgi:steroid 5-alpha reductase family enzyme